MPYCLLRKLGYCVGCDVRKLDRARPIFCDACCFGGNASSLIYFPSHPKQQAPFFAGYSMRELTFTYFLHKRHTRAKPFTKPWPEWIKAFSTHDIRGSVEDSAHKDRLDQAKDGLAIVLGTIKKRLRRLAKNVEEVHALSLDLEGLTDNRLEDVLNQLKPFEWFVWTTHKSGSIAVNEQTRLRVILPLEQPITPEEHAWAWKFLNSFIGGVNDPSTKDVSRLNFLPSTFDISKAWTFHNEGKWLDYNTLEASTKVVTSVVSEYDQEKQLDSITRYISNINKHSPHKLKEELKLLKKGESFAEPGLRHKMMLSLTMFLAMKDQDLSRKTLLKLFEASLHKMFPDTFDLEFDKILSLYSSAVYKTQEAIKEKIKAASQGEPYTPAQIQKIAYKQGFSVKQLKNKWVIQKAGTAWFLDEKGEYRGPYTKEDLNMASTRYLSRAPVGLFVATPNGIKMRGFASIAQDAGSLADSVISDLATPFSKFNTNTSTMHEAITPVRTDLVPEFNEDVDKLLRIMGGTEELYTKLKDWFSCCSDLNKMLCAVYFDGVPSSGKTLIAYGLAKIWTTGPPAEIESALGDFNEELIRCPIVLADEAIPLKYKQSATTLLRSMLSTTSRTLKRKYLPPSEVRGSIRLILAANNDFLLETKGVSSSDDLKAIAQRFLYIKVQKEAAEFLNGISRSTKTYLEQEGIAKHALWLAKNHVVANPGKRFWVEGDISQMHRLLMTGSFWNSLVCEWLVKYLMNPTPFDALSNGFIKRDGRLLVNDQAISEGWNMYLNVHVDCETAKVGSALKALSSDQRVQRRWKNARIRYRIIDIDHLLSWSDRYNIGDEKTMLSHINGEDHGQVLEFAREGQKPLI